MKTRKLRRPHGRWIYYILYEDILWPCPVKWEWESTYEAWLPFYYSPTLEFIAGDPAKAVKVNTPKERSQVRKQVRPEWDQ